MERFKRLVNPFLHWFGIEICTIYYSYNFDVIGYGIRRSKPYITTNRRILND